MKGMGGLVETGWMGWEDGPRPSWKTYFRLKVPHSVGADRIRPLVSFQALVPLYRPWFPKFPKKQKARCLLTAGSRIKLGTDLLSHLLRQYHRLWRA